VWWGVAGWVAAGGPLRHSCRADLDIAGVVKIPVWTFGKTAVASLPSMKKLSTAVGAEEGAVVMDRQYRCGTVRWHPPHGCVWGVRMFGLREHMCGCEGMAWRGVVWDME
jgi:hypothetical protein